MAHNARYWIDRLAMLPHPEGGYFKETFRASTCVNAGWGERTALTSIFYLLEAGGFSAFHRIKSDELWYFHDGGTLLIHEIETSGNLKTHRLSSKEPFASIKPGNWFASELDAQTEFVLVSCAVAPGFDFDDFELASKELVHLYPEHEELIARLSR